MHVPLSFSLPDGYLHSSNLLLAGTGYQYAARQMIKQGRGGRIIGASSVAGKQGLPLCSAYCASKFAVRGLTQAVGEHSSTAAPYRLVVAQN